MENTQAALVSLAQRRALEAQVKADEKRRWTCKNCDETHDNYNAHVEHELCGDCREAAFDEMRETKKCCRCGSDVVPFNPFAAAGASARQHGRFLVCCTCGLVISKDPEDRVGGLRKEYEPR